MNQPEPWLRGPIEGVSPYVAPILYTFQQAREDLARFTEGLTTEQVWMKIGDLNPVGREIAHIAGSVDRLVTYLEGRQLSEQQLRDIQLESTPGATTEELMERLEKSFRRAETVVRNLDTGALTAPREVGRKRLPTTVIGLIVHICEHTQRHVGQAIAAAKLARGKVG